MFHFLRSLSRTVHEVHHEQEDKADGGACMSLTVWKKSLLMSCNGFTVIDSNGNFVYRVDNYRGCREEVILMDGSGKPVLTLRRSKALIRLVDSWLVYEGEAGGHCRTSKSSKKPICSLKKHINILYANRNVLAYATLESSDKRHTYMIEGSYAHRSCKVLDESRRVVAEIKRKEAMKGGVYFGLEVFLLVVQPSFDPGFAVALVLLLDQMFS